MGYENISTHEEFQPAVRKLEEKMDKIILKANKEQHKLQIAKKMDDIIHKMEKELEQKKLAEQVHEEYTYSIIPK